MSDDTEDRIVDGDEEKELSSETDDLMEPVSDSEDGVDVVPPEEPSDADALRELMEYNFMVYTSYVVKERAIPDVDDGLKPVQRRILHTLHTIDDGRMHKVSGVVGDAMKYHPHGDASIYDALVVLANKDYFIDRQGNFGNILTGDPAAAGRYIECRLSKFGKEVLFNPAVTEYVDSYDGRNKEPVVLPAKVPALLMMGTDGIVPGMVTHVFPHNFNELLKAEIAILKDEPFHVYPDFPTGGLMDVSGYADGLGDIRVRAKIEADGDKKVVIREIPAGSTTDSLIESIEKACKAGKLKIAAINDYTAEEVNIEITLQRGIYAEETIQELYAYTDCQKVLHSSLLVIQDNRPVEMTVTQVLRRNVQRLQEIFKAELELELAEEKEALQRLSLERIFIENRIYKRIEKCTSLPKIQETVRTGLEPFRDMLQRDVSDEDVTRLLQIPIRRISLFDLNKNQEDVDAVAKRRETTEYNLAHQVEYAISYVQGLLDRYGSLYPRRTEITGIDDVDRKEIARRNVKVYHDKVNYFVGTGVKSSSKDAEPLVCTEFDRLMLLRTDGTCQIIPIESKTYVGQAKYLFVYDKDQVFSILYRNKKEGTWFAKRFQIGQYILSKEYHIVPEGCVIEALYTNSGVVLSLELAANRRRAYNDIKVDFESLPLRGREARGFKLTHYPVVKINVVNRGTDKPQPPPESPDAEEETPQDDMNDTGRQETPPQPEPPPAAEPVAPAPIEHIEVTEPPREVVTATSTEPPQTPPPKPDKKASSPKKAATKTRPPKPESPKPESPKPESPKPESPKPESPKPESPKPESPRKFHQDDLPFFL